MLPAFACKTAGITRNQVYQLEVWTVGGMTSRHTACQAECCYQRTMPAADLALTLCM